MLCEGWDRGGRVGLAFILFIRVLVGRSMLYGTVLCIDCCRCYYYYFFVCFYYNSFLCLQCLLIVVVAGATNADAVVVSVLVILIIKYDYLVSKS